MLGTTIRQKTWNSFAPSMRAASMISSGIDLMAADSTTIANPTWIQIMITMSSRLFHGVRTAMAPGSCRTPITIPFSSPMFDPNPAGR